MVILPVFSGHVELLESVSEVSAFFSSVEDDSLLIFDWETTGLEYNALPLGLALYTKKRNPVFVPVDIFFEKGIPMTPIRDLCNQHFKRLRMVGHNTKFDDMICYMQGIRDYEINADTLVMVHLVNPDLEKQLEKRVFLDFGFAKKTFSEICGKKWDKINWASEGDDLLELLAGYAGEDAYWEYRLYEKYSKLMDEDAWRVHDKIEIPFVRVLRDMKIRGVLIDVDFLNEMGKDVQKKLTTYIDDIYEAAGCVFNINSSKQKQEVFFDRLKMPVISTTKSGGRSTDAATMEELAVRGYPIGTLMVRYSELQKLNSGYIVGIPNLVDSQNVLRGDINSCGTKTGRVSASNPNLQNQPNNYEFPVRKAFIPRPGYAFLNYDYSQLELRVMAHMSKDKHFTACFRNNEDPHGDVATRLHISRKGAKVVNFGVLYGMGPTKLAYTLDISEAEAKKIITVDYMETYDGFARWKAQTERYVVANGYVKNLFGRVRRLPDATRGTGDKKKYYGALRRSVNTIIQGTGADMVKLAMIKAYHQYRRESLDAYLILQVHDEILVEASLSDMHRAEQILIECMEQVVKLDVPLLVDGKIILDWSEMKDDTAVSLPKRFDYSVYSSLL